MRRRIMIALLALALAVPAALIGAFTVAVARTPLPEVRLPEATVIFDASGNIVARLFTQNRQTIPLSDMPQYLLDAIVAVEDHHFYHHWGLDPRGIARAMVRNLSAGEIVEGGSTITQQLAKNLYLSHDRTLHRKLREAILAAKLERKYSKNEILALYWNSIYLGAGTYGVEAAAQSYFGKHARDLTLAEAALLAGLPRAPENYSPLKNREAARKRRNLVLDKMAEHGFITRAQAEAAKQEPVRLANAPDTPDAPDSPVSPSGQGALNTPGADDPTAPAFPAPRQKSRRRPLSAAASASSATPRS